MGGDIIQRGFDDEKITAHNLDTNLNSISFERAGSLEKEKPPD